MKVGRRTVEQLKDVYRESYLEHYQIYRHIKEGDPKRARIGHDGNLSEVEKRFRQDQGKKWRDCEETSR